MTPQGVISFGLFLVLVVAAGWAFASWRMRKLTKEMEEQRRRDERRRQMLDQLARKDTVERIADYVRGYPVPPPPPPRRSSQAPKQPNPGPRRVGKSPALGASYGSSPRSKASDDSAPTWPNTSFQQAYTRASDPDPTPSWSGGGGSSGGGGASGSWDGGSSSSSSDSGSSSGGGGGY